MTRGRFITVEGIEGVGKSTNMTFIATMLDESGIPVLRSREPGGTPTAERIREILLEHGDEPMPPIAEMLLFFASRSLHLENAIRPALAAGTWVLCDRFTDASRAYQGIARQLGLERIDTLADWVHDGLEPDLTLLLDAPSAVGLSRAGRRGQADRMESETESFYERAREAYLQLARENPQRFRVIDAAQPLKSVQAAIAEMVRGLIEKSHQ
ncbi:MAG: dTMP kinase [Gammaproteobacteria bacterium]|nr:dTMP kinase [Gammaproteobacteria bacterium]